MQLLTESEPARGEMLQVAPSITRIVAPNPGPMTYWGTNTYLIETDSGTLVVDPGPDDPAHVEAVLRATAGSRVEAILLTHTHHDHIGALPALRAAVAAPVAAFHTPAEASVVPDIQLRDGDRLGPWQAIATPGHAPDHLCFLGPDGVLISGDHVMGWSTTVVGPPPSGSMGDYFRSLDRLLGIDCRVYLPGHGPPLARPGPFVTALLEHRHAREAAIAAALGPSPTPVDVLTSKIYSALDPALRRAAERNVLAHLHKLGEDGRARQDNGLWRSATRT